MPEYSQLGACLHDYQTVGVWDYDYKYRKYPNLTAVPETVVTYNKSQFVTLTPDWQWFWYRNLIYCCFGHFDETKLTAEETSQMHKGWLSLIKGTRAFTNGNGPETNWEVITGTATNEGAEYIKHDCLMCGGNPVRINPQSTRLGGQTLYAMDCLDGSKPPPDVHEVNADTRPDLIQRATISHWEELSNGTYRVDPFPQFSWANSHSVFLNISRTANYVPVNRVSFITTFIPNPYNPDREMNFANDC